LNEDFVIKFEQVNVEAYKNQTSTIT